LYEQLKNKNKKGVNATFFAIYKINVADNSGKEKQLQAYKWRSDALSRKLDLSELVFVIGDICGAMAGSSGYLGAISDRSKELYFNHLTVGQYLMQQIDKNPHFSMANIVFYRQDYLDEFERIWEEQAKHHQELTPELKSHIRDYIIFHQRPLKSKKSMLDVCTFENRTVTYTVDGKTKSKLVGLKVCPKSSPLFQEFKIWQILNNLAIRNEEGSRSITLDEMNLLANELQYQDKMKKDKVLKVLFGSKGKQYDLNYPEIEGNRTLSALVRAYAKILTLNGSDEYNIDKMSASEIETVIGGGLKQLGVTADIIHFHSDYVGKDYEQQPLFRLWHLLYSYEGDNSATGNVALINRLKEQFGFDHDSAVTLSAVTFQDDYGNLSSKAMRLILPRLKAGNEYSKACSNAGYRHSERSRTREELDQRQYKDHLDQIPRGALRNPVVEKILNQMIHVVNGVSAAYGKPDEIRIELARELKRNAQERADMTKSISDNTIRNEQYKKEIQDKFGFSHVSGNDILRYRLYKELEPNGFHTLYSKTYIPEEKLFSKEFDIEHIIPQARLFDDSFSNKTLETRQVNIDKGASTAMDYMLTTYSQEEVEQYKQRLRDLFQRGCLSQAKYKKLLMREADIPSDFIDRDLRNTQYISRKACELLEDMCRTVVATTGSITDRLRDDWQLVNVMQELNWDKYNALGLTETFQDHDGRTYRRIKDWTKRNDHRHHAMDALTIAFTKPSYIQYLNNLNARSDKAGAIYAIQQKELYKDTNGNLRFLPPMPLDQFRYEAKIHLQQILISIKAKNKVLTPNVNKTKKHGSLNKRVQLTPRGQLHNESVYGCSKQYATRQVAVGSKMTAEMIALVAKKNERQALQARLDAFGGDAKKAFTGKNAPDKNPIWLDEAHSAQLGKTVKIVEYETYYPIRKEISPELKIDKVIDKGIQQLLRERLAKYGGDAKKAFSNLEEDPIWVNQAKGIALKRVRISGIANAVPLHDKKDHFGKPILDAEEHKIPTDYVSPSNNHHVAIFRDANGVLQEHVVSFMEATARGLQGLPVVDKDYNSDLGWQFLFTMKQNEYFVFPSPDFSPADYDLTNPAHNAIISQHLYRVQKITHNQYFFRHHLETNVEYPAALKGLTWKSIWIPANLEGIVKVRVNHIGQIVAVGEY
ncbi:MAG: type II CRISPR RNA-guided endonuclease Cas9, partial [Bacteroidales bacterium]|nr:type II CRISPR RNA-guided endonuclease Cas9 [Candidatus Colimorpha onthohippi]